VGSAVVDVDEAVASVPTAPPAADDDDLLSGPAWGRHPLDIVRLILASLTLVICGALAFRHPDTVRSVSVDLVALVARLPRWVRDLLLGATQLAAIVVPMVMLARLVRTRRLLLTAVGAAAVAAGLMALLQGRLDAAVPHRVQEATLQSSWVAGAAFPSGAYLAGLTAGIVVLEPILSRGWRRTALVAVGIGALCRIVTAVAAPLNVAITLSLGAVVGSAILAAFGSPRRTASRRAVLAGLTSAGFPAVTIEPYTERKTQARTFVAATGGGKRAFVKLLGHDERSADLLYRGLKALRVKDLDDERPNWSPEELVQHEALTSLLAARRGVPVPDVVAVGSTDGGDGLLAVELVDGSRLDELDPEDITDDLLDQAWAVLDALRDQGIAHRWLTARHLLVGEAVASVAEAAKVRGSPDGPDSTMSQPVPTVTLVDFHWAALQAEPEQLGADVAMLAVSLALLVGAERAVAAAARVLSQEELARALPVVQPLALPDDLRDATKGNKAILPLVREQIQKAAGGVEYKLADIERISLAKLVGLAGLVVASYTVLSFASNSGDILNALKSMSLADAPLLVFLAILPYAVGAATLISVVPKRLPYFEVLRLMLAQSFLNRFTPANAGGMALRVRYLQKRGVDFGGAAAGVALTSAASAIGQVVVLLIFAAWAGSKGGTGFSLPQVDHVVIFVVVVAVLAGVVWLTPFGRRVVARRIDTTLKSVWTTLRKLATQPGRFVTLFGTTLAGKVAVIVAFIASCQALDVNIGFPKLALLYLTASTVAAAAPSPGGVGAVEAALTAALTGAGAPPAQALSAVFLFRLATYWLPVPFGYLSLHRLQRTVLA
jgi:uncharacterized protein (TIRG00374 family)